MSPARLGCTSYILSGDRLSQILTSGSISQLPFRSSGTRNRDSCIRRHERLVRSVGRLLELFPLTSMSYRICNYVGNEAMVEQTLRWSGQRAFGQQSLREWTVDGESAGTTKSHGPLTFATVYGAG
jgi:hypothetical protein